MAHALRGLAQIGAFGRLVDAFIGWHEARTGSSGEVDDRVLGPGANEFDHFAVVIEFHARFAGLWIAHVNVRDGGAGVVGVKRRLRDLRGGDRYGREFAGGVVPAVTAQLMMTFGFMDFSVALECGRL